MRCTPTVTRSSPRPAHVAAKFSNRVIKGAPVLLYVPLCRVNLSLPLQCSPGSPVAPRSRHPNVDENSSLFDPFFDLDINYFTSSSWLASHSDNADGKGSAAGSSPHTKTHFFRVSFLALAFLAVRSPRLRTPKMPKQERKQADFCWLGVTSGADA